MRTSAGAGVFGCPLAPEDWELSLVSYDMEVGKLVGNIWGRQYWGWLNLVPRSSR